MFNSKSIALWATLVISNLSNAGLNDGLVAYYPFNGDANDASGNGNNGTVNGATLTADRFGNANSAYNFNGTSNYIEVPHSTNLTVQNYKLSVSLWVKKFGYTSNLYTIVRKGISCYYPGWQIFSQDSKPIFFNAWDGGSINAWNAISSNALQNNEWTHIIGSSDGTIVKIYVNGVQVGISSVNAASLEDNWPLTIGASKQGCGISHAHFNGLIDDIRIYNRALTAVDIQQLYQEVTTQQLNDTGIKNCSNATQNGLPCPVAGFPGQDAEYGTNSFNFTKLDANGNVLPVTATNHACVKDNITGLIWEVKTDNGGVRDKDNTYTFNAAAQFAATVNASGGLCGFTDWRVPNPKELLSIVNSGLPSPTIDVNYFPNTLGAYFWTSSLHASNFSSAWIVDFTNNGNVHNYDRYANNPVRLVRGAQAVANFVSNSNGTVTDQTTGLIWAKCPEGKSGDSCNIGNFSALTWTEALAAARNSRLGGYSDWRLPNFKELQSLIDYSIYGPSINTNFFPNTPSDWFWTSSPTLADADLSVWVLFGHGHAYGYSRASTPRVRLVRGGQADPTFAINIATSGTGTGTVTSTPAGINCGGSTGSPTTCSANFANNTLVTLATTPGNGSVFSGWSEDSDPDCTDNQVTLNINKICTAIFNIIAPPNVVTNSPSIVTTNTARLQGTINPNYAQTTVTFACNNRSPISGNPNFIAADAGTTEVYANLSGLTCNTQYTCRCVATNSAGTTNGNYQTFTTSGTTCTPLAVTNQANAITPTSAILNATVTPNGANTGVIFEFGLTTNYGTNIFASVNTISATSAAKAIRGNVHGLICNTTYNYRIKAVNSFGTSYGTNASFKTLSCPDLIVTKIISNPTMPTANGTFSAMVTIKNQGGILTDGAFVDVWSNKTTVQTCGAFGDNWAVIDTLSAGASTTVTVDLPAGTPGTKMLRAFVDSDCSVTESNDTNNQGTAFYSVNQPPAKVDFGITGITLNPVAPAVNGTFTAAVTVKNQGTVAGDGKSLDVWSNQTANQVCGAVGNKRLAVGTLNAGASKTLTFTGIAAGAAGSKIFRAFVDSGCSIGEKLESNNQLVKAYNTVKR